MGQTKWLILPLIGPLPVWGGLGWGLDHLNIHQRNNLVNRPSRIVNLIL